MREKFRIVAGAIASGLIVAGVMATAVLAQAPAQPKQRYLTVNMESDDLYGKRARECARPASICRGQRFSYQK